MPPSFHAAGAKARRPCVPLEGLGAGPADDSLTFVRRALAEG
jgi:hypothetical protein